MQNWWERAKEIDFFSWKRRRRALIPRHVEFRAPHGFFLWHFGSCPAWLLTQRFGARLVGSQPAFGVVTCDKPALGRMEDCSSPVFAWQAHGSQLHVPVLLTVRPDPPTHPMAGFQNGHLERVQMENGVWGFFDCPPAMH